VIGSIARTGALWRNMPCHASAIPSLAEVLHHPPQISFQHYCEIGFIRNLDG
jgi:hypothetical protein